jgi:hypothetical protein
MSIAIKRERFVDPAISPAWSVWTPERDAELLRLLDVGLTYAAAGTAMRLSKGQCIGRARRLRRGSEPKAKRRDLADGQSVAVAPTAAEEVAPPSLPPQVVVVTPVPAAIYKPPLVGKATRCQFPLWGFRERPTHRYCDAPSVTGFSWCAEHHERCFTQAPARRAA